MRRAALIVAAALSLPVAGASAAAPKLSEVPGAKFPDRSWVLSLPERRELTADQLVVRENDGPVRDLRVAAGDSAGARTFGVVLAIDASESMKAGAIDRAVEAARTFAARRRPGQPLGLLYFSRDQRAALQPSTDADEIAAALASVPELTKGTRIFDAGAAAIAMLERARIRAGSVVLLSDGADAGSTATAPELAAAARRASVRVHAVGLDSPSSDAEALQAIARDTGGLYAQARSAADLDRIYAGFGDQLAREYLVSYRSLAPLGARVEVAAGLAGGDELARASYAAPRLDVAAPASEQVPAEPPVPVFVVALAIGLLLALAVVLAVRGPKESVRERIGAFVDHDPDAFTRAAGAQLPRSGLSAATEGLLERLRWWPRFARLVEISRLGVPPAQVAALLFLLTAGLVLAMLALDRGVGAVLLAGTPLYAVMVLRVRIDRVRREFSDQLAETLQVVASAMRAGHSFEGGLAVAAEDAAEPMRGELRRVVHDDRLGVPLEEAMARVAERMESREFDQVGTIVVTQRAAGGNVAELLDRAVETIHHRADLRRLVRGLTAQGRAGGVVVTAMPFGMALILSVLSPGYFDPLLASNAGQAAVMAALVCMGLGWLLIRRVVDIKV